MPSPGRIDSDAERSASVGDALALARRAHAGQRRETGGGELPFLEHPLAVGELLSVHGYPDRVLAAGLLHDALEHADLSAGAIRAGMGDEIAELVEALTEDESIEDYEERKREHRRRVAAAGPEARAIFAADKATNVATLRAAYAAAGEGVDARLPISLERKLRAWQSDLDMLRAAAPGSALVERLAAELAGLTAQRAGAEQASAA